MFYCKLKYTWKDFETSVSITLELQTSNTATASVGERISVRKRSVLNFLKCVCYKQTNFSMKFQIMLH